MDISNPKKLATYQTWLEDDVIAMLRTRAPETYEQLVAYLREFILTPWGDDGED